MKRYVLAILLAAGCRAGSPGSSSSGAASASAEPRAPQPARLEIDASLVEKGRVKLAKVERGSATGELLLAGDAAPGEDGEADVGALVAGRVATLEVAEGERVKKGQVLARIDAPEAGKATAELLAARGKALVASKKLARQLALEKQGATSQNAIDEARAEDQAARAELAGARTRVLAMGAGEPADPQEGAPALPVAARVPVRAPIDGVVVKRDAVLGAPVTIERSLFHLVAPERLVVRARLPETRGAAIRVGSPATLRPRAAGATAAVAACAAKVESTFGVVDEATRTVPLRVRPTEACAWLMPGSYVDVIVRAADEPDGGARDAAILVPAEALVDVRGVPTIFVATDKPGAFLPRAVRPGATSGARVAIEAGLDEGERIVVEGALLLKGEALRSLLEGD
jgi:cobalt-zinc-cadmium efflux system membrane fusion protein